MYYQTNERLLKTQKDEFEVPLYIFVFLRLIFNFFYLIHELPHLGIYKTKIRIFLIVELKVTIFIWDFLVLYNFS